MAQDWRLLIGMLIQVSTFNIAVTGNAWLLFFATLPLYVTVQCKKLGERASF
jgi:hypothetical protein